MYKEVTDERTGQVRLYLDYTLNWWFVSFLWGGGGRNRVKCNGALGAVSQFKSCKSVFLSNEL